MASFQTEYRALLALQYDEKHETDQQIRRFIGSIEVWDTGTYGAPTRYRVKGMGHEDFIYPGDWLVLPYGGGWEVVTEEDWRNG